MAKKQSNDRSSRKVIDDSDDCCDNDDASGNLLGQFMTRLPAKSRSRIKCATGPRRMLETDNPSVREILTNSSGLFYRVWETKHAYTNNTKSAAMVHEVLRQPSYTFMASGMLPASWTPQVSLDFLPCYPNFSIFDSCNGLLLCNSYHYPSSSQYVCNPLTRSWVALPPPKSGSSYGELLAFDPKRSHCFQVVSQPRLPLSPIGAMEVEVFSSETGKWVKLELPMSGSGPSGWSTRHWTRSKCFLNETVYALVHPQYLIAFRLKEESNYRWIQLPELCDDNRLFTFTGVSNGHLYHITNDKSVIRIWMMKDGETNEWVLKKAVSVTTLAEMVSLPLCYRHWEDPLCDFFPLALHPVLSVVFLRTHCMVYKYDFVSGKLEEVTEVSRRNHHQTISEVASCDFSLHAFSPCFNPFRYGDNWRKGAP